MGMSDQVNEVSWLYGFMRSVPRLANNPGMAVFGFGIHANALSCERSGAVAMNVVSISHRNRHEGAHLLIVRHCKRWRMFQMIDEIAAPSRAREFCACIRAARTVRQALRI